ncbi:MAG: hypothetical protein QM775_06325 [Pirellulales bacterium]
MNDPGITILLEGNRRAFEPGDSLAAEYRIDSLTLVDAQAIEASVLWYTVGKGDEDIAVHHFVRQTTDGGAMIDLRRPQRLRAVLPASPLSYDGVIVKVRWCVRVRLFLGAAENWWRKYRFNSGASPRPCFRRCRKPPWKKTNRRGRDVGRRRESVCLALRAARGDAVCVRARPRRRKRHRPI